MYYISCIMCIYIHMHIYICNYIYMYLHIQVVVMLKSWKAGSVRGQDLKKTIDLICLTDILQKNQGVFTQCFLGGGDIGRLRWADRHLYFGSPASRPLRVIGSHGIFHLSQLWRERNRSLQRISRHQEHSKNDGCEKHSKSKINLHKCFFQQS